MTVFGGLRRRLRSRLRRLNRRLRTLSNSAQRALVWTSAAVVSGLVIGVILGHNTSVPLAPPGVHGYDVSWPQCDGGAAHHMPGGHPPYVILGLTNGIGVAPNPCLKSQLDWARARGVRVGAYVVASYPTKAELVQAGNGLYGACGASPRCRLHNAGATEAQDALATMRSVGLPAPRVWIDVEFRRTDRWSHRHRANAAVIQGYVRGLRAMHVGLGVYTTSSMWTDVTGGYHLNVPNWVPVGEGGARLASDLCPRTATGGTTWLVQYTRSLDSDLTCPVIDPKPLGHNRLGAEYGLSRIVRPLP